MMLWRRDRNWGRKCSIHVTGNNIGTRIHEYSYLPRSHPSRTVPACSLFPTMLLLRMYELCIEPGHLATMFVECICASQMICTLMEWNCFLLTYTNSSCDGAFIAMCAVDSSDYIRKTGCRCKLRFNVGLFSCIVGIWYTWLRCR